MSCMSTENGVKTFIFKMYSFKKKFKKKTFYNCIVLIRFLPWEMRVAFSGESQLQQSHATHPTVHAGCFSVSKIHQTLTWTTGSLTCAQTLMNAIAHEGCTDTHKRVCTES